MSQKTLGRATYQIVVFVECPSSPYSNRKPKIYCVPNKWIFMFGDRPFCLFPCSPFDDHEYPDNIAFLIRTSSEPSPAWRTYAIQIIQLASTYESAMKLLTKCNKDDLYELPHFMNHTSTIMNSVKFHDTSGWSDSSIEISFSDLSDCDLCDCSGENKSNISESTPFSQDFSLSTRNPSYKNIVNSTFKSSVNLPSFHSLDWSEDLSLSDESCTCEQSNQTMEMCRIDASIYNPALARTKENELTLPMKNIHDFYEFEKKLKDNYQFIQQFINSLLTMFDENLPPVANIHKILRHYVTIDLLSLLVQPTLLESRPHYNASLFSSYLFGFLVSKNTRDWEPLDSNYYFAAVGMHLNLNKTILSQVRQINS